jgi:hypothetical protein
LVHARLAAGAQPGHDGEREGEMTRRPGIEGDDIRRLAQRLPGTEERSHHGHPDFRVGGRIFASLSADETRCGLRLTYEEAEALARSEPDTVRLVSKPARVGWVSLALDRVAVEDVADLLDEAWRLRASADLLAAADTGRPRPGAGERPYRPPT